MNSDRYYVPGIGRFASADSIVPAPASPQSFNRYSYVGNNPLNGTDPDGRCYPACTAVAGGLIGAAVQLGINAYQGEPLTTNLGQAIFLGTAAGVLGPAAISAAGAVASTTIGTAALIGGGVGGVTSAIFYATALRATGQPITAGGVTGAFVAGAITGAISTLATPIAGSIVTSSFIGGTATNSVLATGTIAVNTIAGGGAYLAGGYTENAVNQALGNPASFTPTVFGFVANAGGNAGASYVAGKLFQTPINAQRTLAQASRFLPRTPKTLSNAFSTRGYSFARNLYFTGGATSAIMGTSAGIFSGRVDPTNSSPSFRPVIGGGRLRVE